MGNAYSDSAKARKLARDQKRTKYVGKPCKTCASPVRYTSSSQCCICQGTRALARKVK